jgi:cell wall-associated NlpC family hydrolase
MDGGSHADASQVISWLEAHPNLQRIEGPNSAFGDLVTFRLARVAHHVGLVLEPPSFIHSIRGYGVIEGRLDDPTYAKRLERVYRPFP